MADKQRILIADDEKAITDIFGAVLESNGYEVTKTFDGEECVQKARGTTFALVVLDVHMPKLDGYEVIKQLKQMKHLKHTPVIFLSGFNTSAENIESGYLLGVTEYWKKPMPVEEFEARVRAILRIAEAGKQLRDLQEVFNAMIVHDLRGPLSGIVGLAELLTEEEGKFSPQEFEMLKSVGTASKQMLHIVNDFLEITRLDAGEQKLHRAPVKLSDVIERCISNCSALMKEKSVGMKADLGHLPMIEGDLGRLEVAFNHLLDNSIRFTPEHGTVSITGVTHDSAIVLSVSHPGKGIPTTDIPMLFDKMRIATPGLRRPGGQTGLGLPICRGIIEAHGGTISVKSKTGEGTEFAITLPVTTPSSTS